MVDDCGPGGLTRRTQEKPKRVATPGAEGVSLAEAGHQLSGPAGGKVTCRQTVGNGARDARIEAVSGAPVEVNPGFFADEGRPTGEVLCPAVDEIFTLQTAGGEATADGARG